MAITREQRKYLRDGDALYNESTWTLIEHISQLLDEVERLEDLAWRRQKALNCVLGFLRHRSLRWIFDYVLAKVRTIITGVGRL